MGTKFTGFFKYASILLLSIVFYQSQAAVYYSQKSLGGSSNPNLVTSWKSSITGGGSSPANFSSGDEFHIVNGDNMIATSLWTISGGGKLVVANGTFTANGFDHLLTADIQNAGTYIVKSAYANLSLGTLTSGSNFTVQYAQGGVTNHLRYLSYGGNLNIAITATSATTINFTGSFSAGGNLSLSATSTSQVFSMNTSATINVTGNFTQNNGTFYTTTSSFNSIYNIGGNLIINNGIWASAKFAGSPTFNVTGNLTMNNGTFYGIINSATGNATYNINGNVSFIGGNYIAKNSSSSGLLTYNLLGNSKTISFNGVTVTNDNHIINVKGSYSLLSNLSLSNALTIASGNSLSIGSNILTLKSSYSGIGSLIGGNTSSITISGTTAQSISLKTITLYSFTINNSNATVTLAGPVTVTTALNLALGTINNTSNSLILNNGCTITKSTGKLTAVPTYVGTVNLIYTGLAISTELETPYNNSTAINNVTFSNTGGTIELFGNITINGILTINGGATFNNKSKVLTAKGNIVNNGTFLNPYSTTVFAGTTTLSGSSAFNFNNVTINTGATLNSVTGIVSVNNTFVANTGSTFNPNGGTVSFTRTSGSQAIPGKIQFYNLDLSNGAAKVFSSTDTIYIANTFTSSGGALTTSNSTISFNGGTQTIPVLAYNNLILAGTGTKTPATSALTVAKNLTISGAAILNGSNVTITVPGQWTSAGTGSYSGTNGTVNFTGAAANIHANGASFNNVTFNSTGAKTFTSAATVTGVLSLTAGTVNTGGLLIVNLTTGAIAGTGAGVLNGNVTFVKNIPTAASNFLAFPVAGATGSDLADDFEFVSPSTNKSRLSIWDCATQKYLSGQPVATAFTQGIGFQFFASASGNVDVTGAYNHAAAGYTTTACTAAANKFVLAGNPFPTTLDWTSAGWTKTNLNDAIYFFNPATGTFATYINGVPSNGGSQYIPSFQGFYITTNGGGIGSLTATNGVRTTLTNPGLYRTTTANTFAVEVSYKNFKDEAVIVLNEEASFDFEGDKDAIKFINPNNAPSLYTTSLGVDYSVNSIPSLGESSIIPLGLKVTESGSYTFSSKNVFDIEGDVYLEDKLTGKLVDLKANPTHTVTVDSTQSDRFQLRFANAGSSSANLSSSSIYYYDGIINVDFVDNTTVGTLSVYSVVGTSVINNVTVNGSGQISTSNLKPGAYIVKVVENGTIVSKKIIIQ